jgi:hypothetical protein
MSSLCQGAAVLTIDFGLFEEVVVQAGAGAGDLDSDEAVVFPVERDEPFGAGRCGGLDGGPASRERVAGEMDAGRVGGGVVGDPHVPIVPGRSASSW